MNVALRWRRWTVIGLALALGALGGCGPSANLTTYFLPGAPAPTATANADGAHAGASSSPSFQRGVAYPKWGETAYGVNDAAWPAAAQDMRDQTAAQWVQLIVSLDQTGYRSTDVYAGSETTTPDNLYVGIVSARQAGLRVFIEPLLNVHGERDNWSGWVTFASHEQAEAWFQSYWQAYEPYVRAARAAGASQISIGAEFDTLQAQYPDLWRWLARQVKTEFGGAITYDANHSILGHIAPAWLRDPDLSYIGVSMYYSLLKTPADLTEPQIATLWRREALPLLDQLSAQTGKPVLLSEIGYRNASDALYHPWTWRTSAPADPALQGSAYQAALAMTASDPHIAGLYFWGWQTGRFAPGPYAVAALRAAWG